MEFAVRILRVDSVTDVPNSDRLSLVRVLGYDSVVNKTGDGSHRFEAGDRILYVPEAAVIPDELLQRHGLWGPNKDTGEIKGVLSGPRGNRVKIATFRKQLSTGLVWPLPDEFAYLPDGSDVTADLGIEKYVPVIDERLMAMARKLREMTPFYEVARLKTYPNLLDGLEVVITEKLEGECLIAVWTGGDRHDDLFHGGRVAIASKGLARQNMCFRDAPEAHREGVVRAAIGTGLPEKMERLADHLGRTSQIMLVSEAIGPGIKKLHYDQKAPGMRGIDICVDGRWLPEAEKDEAMATVGIGRVPVLWRGIYSAEAMEDLRQGDTTIGGKHIREGVVATYVGEQTPIQTSFHDEIRPIVKVHSDVFQRKFGHED